METGLVYTFQRRKFNSEKEKIVFERIKDVVSKYPNYVWEIGYSGGKDSTVVLKLILKYLLNEKSKKNFLPQKIYILYSDTLLDLPMLRKMALKTLEAIEDLVKEKNLDEIVVTKALKPDPNEDFFTCMIEKGYPIPHNRFRWCIPRLKLRPAKNFITDIIRNSEFDGYIMVSGVRINESAQRAKLMIYRGQDGYIQNGLDHIKFAPIIDWTQEEVWKYLLEEELPWGIDPKELLDIYMLADSLPLRCGSECEAAPTSRFGCWVCTVVTKDKMLNNIIKNTGDREAETLLEIKKRMREISRNRAFRVIDKNGRARSLNEDGRYEIVNLLAKVINETSSGLEGYLDDPVFKNKVINWFKEWLNKRPNGKYYEEIKKAFEKINKGT